MSKQKNQRPAEQSAAPPVDPELAVLTEIRDLLARSVEFNDWLKDRLVANGALV